MRNGYMLYYTVSHVIRRKRVQVCGRR